MLNRKKINDFLETGKGKKEIEELLHDDDFREEYLEIARMEAALHQAWEEKSSIKLKRKPVRIPFFRIAALAAIVTLGFFAYKFYFSKVAFHVQSGEKVLAGKVIDSKQEVDLILNDGSELTFKGQAKFKFLDENNIEVYSGLVEAKVKPRINNKLSIHTPSGPFTVIGTEFSLLINKESTFLDVTEGKVSVADKLIGMNERALLKKNGELLTKKSELESYSGSLELRKLASMPTASIVSDFTVNKNAIKNLVTGEEVLLTAGIKESEKGLSFNEQSALQIKPSGEPALAWNLSFWLKFIPPNDRKSILSHENFVDQNMGGWNLYSFNRFMRLHTVMQPYLHDRGDFELKSPEWFHVSINVKTLGHGTVEEKFYINGILKETHQRKMLFLKKQVNFYLGGLSKNAMSAFSDSMKDHNFYFKGEMGHLVYMNSILSESQIKSLYDSTKNTFK